MKKVFAVFVCAAFILLSVSIPSSQVLDKATVKQQIERLDKAITDLDAEYAELATKTNDRRTKLVVERIKFQGMWEYIVANEVIVEPVEEVIEPSE